METDYFVCVVSCRKYLNDASKKQDDRYNALNRCKEKNTYFLDCVGHLGAIDSVSKFSTIILEYGGRGVCYGEVKDKPHTDGKADEIYVEVDKLNWMDSENIGLGVKFKDLMKNVIEGTMGDKVKKVEPEYAVEIINEIKSARKKHKIGQQKR